MHEIDVTPRENFWRLVGQQRKAEKAAGADRAANSFEVVAREWLAVKQPEWTPGQFAKERDRLENHAFPRIGAQPVANIGVAEIRPLLMHLVKQNHIEQSHRLRHQLTRKERLPDGRGARVYVVTSVLWAGAY